MPYLYGVISIIASILLAFIFGLPIVSDFGLTFFHYEYLILGFVASIGYYYYIYNREKSFRTIHLLSGLSFGLVALIIIMTIQYVVLKNSFGDAIPTNQYLHIFKFELLLFLIGSIVIPMFIRVGQAKCKRCQQGFFSEELLYKPGNGYGTDAKQIIKIAANKQSSELRDFITDRRISTGYGTKTHHPQTQSIYLLTCNNCGTQYIASSKQREINDELPKHTLKIITELNLDTKLELK